MREALFHCATTITLSGLLDYFQRTATKELVLKTSNATKKGLSLLMIFCDSTGLFKKEKQLNCIIANLS